MKRVLITVAQQEEIAALATKHGDALIAYGADMYRKGIIKGALAAFVGFTIAGVSIVVKKIKDETNAENKEES